jgi:hypothetical protein
VLGDAEIIYLNSLQFKPEQLDYKNKESS